uniref:Calcium dependent mitochondrial carrier protein n=1 Tax=Ganoderma boninense TaxID=34458 RepID=A0A5K1K7Q5_9APHY|nr:Calcium dependent mitochondrial carrier protein [Ganoderma boninense]
MDHAKQITFYTAAYSPYSHRVQIALDEAGAQYKTHEFGKSKGSKPEWYYTINPLGKIPSITYGGPDVPSDQPSAESEKLSESIALLEFIADIYPEANLLPDDAVLRAKARRIISLYENYVHDAFKAAVFLGQPADGLLQALSKFQSALAPAGFAVGQYSIADCAVAPFLALAGEEYTRFRTYIQDLTERPSFRVSWDEDAQIELWKDHPAFKRTKAPPAHT